MQLVHVIRFTTTVAPYYAGDEAGFDATTARIYIDRGLAILLKADVPKVSPDVDAMDARRRADELRALLNIAEAEAADAAAVASRVEDGGA